MSTSQYIYIYIADTNTGVCSDIGNTNTSFHSVSYCPIWCDNRFQIIPRRGPPVQARCQRPSLCLDGFGSGTNWFVPGTGWNPPSPRPLKAPYSPSVDWYCPICIDIFVQTVTNSKQRHPFILSCSRLLAVTPKAPDPPHHNLSFLAAQHRPKPIAYRVFSPGWCVPTLLCVVFWGHLAHLLIEINWSKFLSQILKISKRNPQKT